jgi:hypothetical protein
MGDCDMLSGVVRSIVVEKGKGTKERKKERARKKIVGEPVHSYGIIQTPQAHFHMCYKDPSPILTFLSTTRTISSHPVRSIRCFGNQRYKHINSI